MKIKLLSLLSLIAVSVCALLFTANSPNAAPPDSARTSSNKSMSRADVQFASSFDNFPPVISVDHASNGTFFNAQSPVAKRRGFSVRHGYFRGKSPLSKFFPFKPNDFFKVNFAPV